MFLVEVKRIDYSKSVYHSKSYLPTSFKELEEICASHILLEEPYKYKMEETTPKHKHPEYTHPFSFGGGGIQILNIKKQPAT